MRRRSPDDLDHAALLEQALADLPGVERVEATFRIGGPVGAQSVVNLHTPETEPGRVVGLLSDALPRCAAVLAEAPTKGNLYLYCYDGDGMRHSLDEVADDLSVAISFTRLLQRVQSPGPTA